MKKIFVVLYCFMFVISLAIQPLAEEPEGIKSRSALLMDMDSGRVLWEQNGYEPLAMASTTKIMTAVYAIEKGNLSDIVVASKNAAMQPNVKMNLSEGEKISLENLLYALMLQSSNDAAVAIAEHISGSAEKFCKEITEKAAEIGAKNTVFKTPNGLDLEDHHSTAYDMALIARYALNNEKFREIIKTPAVSFKSDKRTYDVTNQDIFLTEYEGAIGVKTGYTGKAGHCFVGAAERNGRTLISVVLASGWGNTGKVGKWTDTKKILNYGFENFENRKIFDEGQNMGEFSVLKGVETYGRAVYSEGLTIPLKKDEKVTVRAEFEVMNAPVRKGDKVGKAIIYIDGKEYTETVLVSAENIEKNTLGYKFFGVTRKWLDLAA